MWEIYLIFLLFLVANKETNVFACAVPQRFSYLGPFSR